MSTGCFADLCFAICFCHLPTNLIYVRARTMAKVHMKVRGQLVNQSVTAPCGTWGSNSGHTAWQQPPLPTETTHWSKRAFLNNEASCYLKIVNWSWPGDMENRTESNHPWTMPICPHCTSSPSTYKLKRKGKAFALNLLFLYQLKQSDKKK